MAEEGNKFLSHSLRVRNRMLDKPGQLLLTNYYNVTYIVVDVNTFKISKYQKFLYKYYITGKKPCLTTNFPSVLIMSGSLPVLVL